MSGARRSLLGRALLFTLTAAAGLLATPATARAGTRLALIVGENVGEADEVRLRYAEDDADKVARLLRDLGGFAAEDVTLLRGDPAASVRRALIRINERLRNESSGDTVLFVYYSGHADSMALHLGGSALPIDELQALLRGSPARTRIMIVDACRSGTLTQVKGSMPAPPFDIHLEASDSSEGAVFLTSSAANEVAQESDDLRGSFFTHYLVSGLLGAADADGDQRVTLNEAYAYAYEGTLRASSRSLAGTQHPTFSFDLRGHRDVVLTWLGLRGDQPRGGLTLPATRSFLVMRDGPDGAVVAETTRQGPARSLTLPPGTYFVRGRGRDDLLEGSVRLAANERAVVDERTLARTAYARLVRKGGGPRERASGLLAGYAARSGLWSSSDLCHGAFAAYELVGPGASIAARIAGCRGGFQNQFLSSTADELSAELEGSHVWDLRRVSLHIALAAGPAVLHQSFATTGAAPARWALAGLVTGGAGMEVSLGGPWFGDLTVTGGVHVLRERGAGTLSHWITPVTLGTRLGLIRRW